MKYRKDKYGNDVSQLGFGCMRFSGNGPAGKGLKIDYDKAESEIMAAFEAGVNYYDTAYLYPGSEELLGKVLESNGIRDKVRIATKLPHYLVKKNPDFDKYFDEQLRRLRTDHVEYYLMHMINDAQSWKRLEGLGIVEWLEAKKQSGAIEQVGFSYHGNSDAFAALLDAYDWDFCQIQYNYLDEHSQAGRAGYDYAVSKGIPLVIMEPLRGGKLANKLPKEAEALFRKHNRRAQLIKELLDDESVRAMIEENGGEEPLDLSPKSPAEWAFRWLWDQPGIMCVLSGMNSIEMVEENCSAADRAEPGCFTDEDRALIAKVVEAINAKTKVGCTGCRYCMPCPAGVDIPGTFSAYNNRYVDGWFTAEKEYMMCTALRKNSSAASNCIGCGKCEQQCPQHINIRKELKNARKVLEGPAYKIARKVVPLVYKY